MYDFLNSALIALICSGGGIGTELRGVGLIQNTSVNVTVEVTI